MAVDKRTKAYRKWNNKDDLLRRCKERYKIMADADDHNRDDALLDIRFNNLPGAQWQENMKTERGDRPCYEYNKTRPRCKRVVNDMRDNRPSGKIRGVEGGDTEIAEIYEGLIRNIANVSHMDNATDYAAKYQVEGGMGCWRVNTDYATADSFEQDIIIEMIENPFSLYCDPSAKDFMRRDARDWVYTVRISRDEYHETYGEDAPAVDFDAHNENDSGFNDDWTEEETVRIAEYWYKKPVKKVLWQVTMPDPETGEPKTMVVDSESDEAAGIPPEAIVGEREVDTHQIMMFTCDGEKIIEGPVEWAGRMFPWVMVFGEYMVIEGRVYWWGLIRHAKDAQRNFNVSKTAIAETIAQTPKSKWWATTSQAEGHTAEWAEADRKNFPFMLYENDPSNPGPPTRMGPADVPSALMMQAETDDQDLKDVMGLPDSQMGQQGDEKSGRAIYARQQQGEVANFDYRDNMNKAVELTYEILIDLIPEIYDTERELRVLGSDGAEDYHKVNQVVQNPETGVTTRVNDLSAGKYDVTVTSGPSFSTQRQEAAEMYMGLTQGTPEIMALAGDLIFKAIDLPYAEEISERIKAMLPPQIQQTLQDGDQEIPPEVQQMMQQAQQAMQQVEQYAQMVEAASQELIQEKAMNDVTKSEIKVEAANVRAARADFEAKVSESFAQLAEKGAGLTEKNANLVVKGAEVKEAAITANVDLEGRENNALAQTGKIDQMLANFMQTADAAVGEINARADAADVAINRSPIGGTTRRVDGKLVADVQFDDGTSKSISAVREGGGLKIVPSEGEAEAEPGPTTE